MAAGGRTDGVGLRDGAAGAGCDRRVSRDPYRFAPIAQAIEIQELRSAGRPSRRERIRQPVRATGAAISVNATQNIGQLNDVGSTVVIASSP